MDENAFQASAVSALPAKTRSRRGNCAFNEDGTTSFAALQAATDSRRSSGLVYVAFLYLDGEDLRALPLRESGAAREAGRGCRRVDTVRRAHVGDGKKFFEAAGRLGADGIVSKRLDSRYSRAIGAPGGR